MTRWAAILAIAGFCTAGPAIGCGANSDGETTPEGAPAADDASGNDAGAGEGETADTDAGGREIVGTRSESMADTPRESDDPPPVDTEEPSESRTDELIGTTRAILLDLKLALRIVRVKRGSLPAAHGHRGWETMPLIRALFETERPDATPDDIANDRGSMLFGLGRAIGSYEGQDVLVDGWGRPLFYRQLPQEDAEDDRPRYELRSAGPDSRFGTEDDLTETI